MEPGATTLAYVFRKLAHTFYDVPEERKSYIVGDKGRTRYGILDATVYLISKIYPELVDNAKKREAFIKKIEQLIATDEGMPDLFKQDFLRDIQARAKTQNYDFAFLISEPSDSKTVISKYRSLGKRIHTLFGYSTLEYENPGELKRLIRKDLSRLDPKEWIVNIGVTQEGIGGIGYEIAKEMGFETAGTVSTKSIAAGGNFSPLVDHIFIVRDTEWGGYIPETNELTSTTEVFLQSSDSMTAFGGGEITSVTLKEAQKRGIPLRYHFMESNKQKAIEIAKNSGKDIPMYFYGPAAKTWLSLVSTVGANALSCGKNLGVFIEALPKN
jgi:hypothetical protein